MKNKIITLTTLMFMTGTFFTGCQSTGKKVESAENKVEEAKQNLYNVQQDSVSDFQKFKIESEEKINSLDKEIAEFKQRLANEKKADNIKLEKRLAELDQKNTVMKTKLKNYKDEGQDKWIAFKNEFSHDMDEIGNAFKDLTVKNTK